MGFDFKRFSVDDSLCAMKVGTDGVLLGAWADASGCGSVLDVGAGSGLVSLLMAQRFHSVAVTAVEIDPSAAEACRLNVSRSEWSKRIRVVCSPIAGFVPEVPFDLIVSNPPFFTEDVVSPVAMRACARHGASLNPLSLIYYAACFLSPTGSLAMITPVPRAGDDSIVYSAEMNRLKLRRMTVVSSRRGQPPVRVLWQFSRVDGQIVRSELSIRDDSGNYSCEYVSLVGEFYLHLPGCVISS